MAVLTCPKCKAEMTEKTWDGISGEECGHCSALWIDYFSLPAWIFDRLSARYNPQVAEEASRLTAELLNKWSSQETQLHCPRCPSHLLRTDEISVEWCQGCRGVMLESDDLERIEAWHVTKLKKKKGVLGWLFETFRDFG
jgi:Zn-finger nucleic acid-binding protein